MNAIQTFLSHATSVYPQRPSTPIVDRTLLLRAVLRPTPLITERQGLNLRMREVARIAHQDISISKKDAQIHQIFRTTFQKGHWDTAWAMTCLLNDLSKQSHAQYHIVLFLLARHDLDPTWIYALNIANLIADADLSASAFCAISHRLCEARQWSEAIEAAQCISSVFLRGQALENIVTTLLTQNDFSAAIPLIKTLPLQRQAQEWFAVIAMESPTHLPSILQELGDLKLTLRQECLIHLALTFTLEHEDSLTWDLILQLEDPKDQALCFTHFLYVLIRQERCQDIDLFSAAFARAALQVPHLSAILTQYADLEAGTRTLNFIYNLRGVYPEAIFLHIYSLIHQNHNEVARCLVMVLQEEPYRELALQAAYSPTSSPLHPMLTHV